MRTEKTNVENRLIYSVIEDNAALGTCVSFPPKSRFVPVKTEGFVAKAVGEIVKTDEQTESWVEFCKTFELEPVVYFIGAPNGLVKIGFAKDLDARFGELLCASPVPLRILAFVVGGRVKEGEYHKQFRAWRRHGEWFELSPVIQAEIDRLSA